MKKILENISVQYLIPTQPALKYVIGYKYLLGNLVGTIFNGNFQPKDTFCKR